ncbi:MAG: hypothetical protein ACRD0L_15250 [Acidimicrobiales bacterium]
MVGVVGGASAVVEEEGGGVVEVVEVVVTTVRGTVAPGPGEVPELQAEAARATTTSIRTNAPGRADRPLSTGQSLWIDTSYGK